VGPHFSWRILCIPDSKNPKTYEVDSSGQRFAAAVGALFGSGCLLQPGIVPRTSLNLDVEGAWSLKNDLQYPPDVRTRVFLTIVEPSVSVNLSKDVETDRVELGFGVGVMIFSGRPFESFNRVFIEPVRLDYRPFAKTPGWDRLVVRGSVMVIPHGFDDQDFGAIPGTFEQSAEVRPQLGFTIDLRGKKLTR